LDFGPDKNKFSLDTELELPELEAPEQLTLGASNKIVNRVEDMPAIFDSKNKTVFYTDSEERKIYTDKSLELGTLNGFYVRLVDGTQVSYEYKPRFIPENKIPNITFKNGTKNNLEYSYTSVNGCGAANFINVIDKSQLETTTVIGTTSTGSDIYAPTLNNPYLVDYYHNKYFEAYGTERLSLQIFASKNPILFFEDPFDRVAVLTNAAFVPAAECGKPVIYLYPETTSEISVKVNPLGGFTYTEPNYERYGDGWNVIATPNSQIFEVEDKTKTVYPYLFWEGRGGIYKAPEVGFSVKREEVDKFLSERGF
jgi:hypothetical protein